MEDSGRRKKRRIAEENESEISCEKDQLVDGKWTSLRLPTEILVHIFEFTNPRTVISAMCVNRHWLHNLDDHHTQTQQNTRRQAEASAGVDDPTQRSSVSCSDRIWSWFYARYYKYGVYRSMFHYPYEPIKRYTLERCLLSKILRAKVRRVITSYVETTNLQAQERRSHSVHTRSLLFRPHIAMSSFQSSCRRTISFEKSGNSLYARSFVGPSAIGWSPAEVSIFLSDGWMPFTYYVKALSETVEGGFQTWQATDGYLRRIRSSVRENSHSKSTEEQIREVSPLGLKGNWHKALSKTWKETMLHSQFEFSSLLGCYASGSAVQRLYPFYDPGCQRDESCFRSFPLTAFALQLRVFPFNGKKKEGKSGEIMDRSGARINVDSANSSYGYSKSALALLRYDSKLQFLPRSLQLVGLWKRLVARLFPGFSSEVPLFSSMDDELWGGAEISTENNHRRDDNQDENIEETGSINNERYTKLYCSPAIGFSFQGTLTNSEEQLGKLRYELSREKYREQRAFHAQHAAPSLLSEAFESRYQVPTNCVLEQVRDRNKCD